MYISRIDKRALKNLLIPIPFPFQYNLNIQSDYIDILSPVAANESAVTVSQSITLTTAEALTDSPSSNAAGTRRRRRALTSSGNMSDLKAEIINALAWRFPNAYFTDVIFYESESGETSKIIYLYFLFNVRTMCLIFAII